jgi:hypothetical protein
MTLVFYFSCSKLLLLKRGHIQPAQRALSSGAYNPLGTRTAYPPVPTRRELSIRKIVIADVAFLFALKRLSGNRSFHRISPWNSHPLFAWEPIGWQDGGGDIYLKCVVTQTQAGSSCVCLRRGSCHCFWIPCKRNPNIYKCCSCFVFLDAV